MAHTERSRSAATASDDLLLALLSSPALSPYSLLRVQVDDDDDALDEDGLCLDALLATPLATLGPQWEMLCDGTFSSLA